MISFEEYSQFNNYQEADRNFRIDTNKTMMKHTVAFRKDKYPHSLELFKNEDVFLNNFLNFELNSKPEKIESFKEKFVQIYESMKPKTFHPPDTNLALARIEEMAKEIREVETPYEIVESRLLKPKKIYKLSDVFKLLIDRMKRP